MGRMLLPVSPDCTQGNALCWWEPESSFELGNSPPITCSSGTGAVLLAGSTCSPSLPCLPGGVDPAMQVINADDAGALFQWLNHAGGWYVWAAQKAHRFVSLVGAVGKWNIWLFSSWNGQYVRLWSKCKTPCFKKQGLFSGRKCEVAHRYCLRVHQSAGSSADALTLVPAHGRHWPALLKAPTLSPELLQYEITKLPECWWFLLLVLFLKKTPCDSPLPRLIFLH